MSSASGAPGGARYFSKSLAKSSSASGCLKKAKIGPLDRPIMLSELSQVARGRKQQVRLYVTKCPLVELRPEWDGYFASSCPKMFSLQQDLEARTSAITST